MAVVRFVLVALATGVALVLVVGLIALLLAPAVAVVSEVIDAAT